VRSKQIWYKKAEKSNQERFRDLDKRHNTKIGNGIKSENIGEGRVVGME
jgi:hypothetical protein